MKPLIVKNLDYSYGQKQALHKIDFEVEKGSFCGLLGPNGAGKSTLFSLLTGLLSAPADRIYLAGFDMALEPRKALSKVGVVFQQPTLELDMSVEQNMRYFAALHGMWGVDTRIDQCLDLVKMRERKKEKVRALNGGHRRRMEIARAMIHQPEILLLDEPTTGLDVQTRQSIVEDVHALSQEGITVLWATHLVDEIWSEDDVVILYQGEIQAHEKAGALAKGSSLLQSFLELTKEEAGHLS